MPWPLLVIAAVLGGVVVGIGAANVWPALLIAGKVGVLWASVAELLFLAIYVFVFAGWAPGPWRRQRLDLGRGQGPSGRQWGWGLLAAISFAVVVHASIVLLFRLLPFPAELFHRGYDFSFIPSLPLQWLACVVSALSAGVCEEMGFRGYMQRPLETRFGPTPAILISALMFTLLHLNKSWALLGMTPIVFGAGVLLGMLARVSGTLLFGILGHWIMDIGLFAYWWTQIAGTFHQPPLAETGIEPSFILELSAFAVALTLVLVSIAKLGSLRDQRTPDQHRVGVGPRRTRG
jgi:membrane protease YdiL (CAAX protease family)